MLTTMFSHSIAYKVCEEVKTINKTVLYKYISTNEAWFINKAPVYSAKLSARLTGLSVVAAIILFDLIQILTFRLCKNLHSNNPFIVHILLLKPIKCVLNDSDILINGMLFC